MKNLASVACIIASSFSLSAQITATLNKSSLSGSMNDEIKIRNNSEINLVAYAVTAKLVFRGGPNRPPFVVYADPVIDPRSKSLPGHQERSVQVRVPHRKDEMGPFIEEPILFAVVFEDGSTAGDAGLLTRLMLRRSNMLLSVENTLETLADAGRRNVPRDQLIERFKKMADSLRHWYLPPEQQIGLSLYQAMVGKLMNLPEPKYGTPFPPSEFVEQESAILRRQRVTLIESQPNLADAALFGSVNNRSN